MADKPQIFYDSSRESLPWTDESSRNDKISYYYKPKNYEPTTLRSNRSETDTPPPSYNDVMIGPKVHCTKLIFPTGIIFIIKNEQINK